jgi:glycine cleavage system H protein
MSNRKFTKDHEWLNIEGDIATIGITNHAQSELGDIVFVELPEIGQTVSSGDGVAVVESTKAASDVYAPLDGEIVAINQALIDEPALINTDAENKAWFFKIKIADKSVLDNFLSAEDYKALIG